MKSSMIMAAAAAALSLMGVASARADTILDYTFSPDAYYSFDGGASYAVTGSFSYDVTTQAILNVDYTRGADHFTTGSIYDTDDHVLFGTFGTDDYDVYQLHSSLALGGTDKIDSATHPYLFVHAGGSVVSAVAANSAVPEPTAWALMIGGFGLAGATLRRRRVAVAA